MIVPTGIGAAIGGHSGDANAAAQVLAAVCDRLIIHPNVVNASDMNEMPSNALYVEGDALDSFLKGDIDLEEVHNNRILVACNEATPDTINAVNAARSVLGIDAYIVVLKTPLIMKSHISPDGASGDIQGVTELLDQVKPYNFDALAVHTPIDVSPSSIQSYKNKLRTSNNNAVNPWGGVEAKLSKELGYSLSRPVAHSPIEPPDTGPEVAHPLLAPEYIGCHLMSVLKGLHRAPRKVEPGISRTALTTHDIDVMVSPLCWGSPHLICQDKNIPIMFVMDNTTINKTPLGFIECISVKSYLEAAGALVAIRKGISLESLRRPLIDVMINL